MDIERDWPSLPDVWAAFRCRDCLAVVAVSMTRDGDPSVRVLHDRGCPAIPSPGKRLYFAPLPWRLTFKIKEET